MVEFITLQLAAPTPSQNQTQAWHWGRRSRWKKAASEELASQLCLGRHGCRPWVLTPKGKRTVVFTRYSMRSLDHGNHIGGSKMALDALVEIGVLIDDTLELVDYNE